MAKRTRPNQRRRNKHWVNVYEVDRAYGGMEEGDWWYNYAICVQTWPCRSRKQAEKLVRWAESQRRYQSHPYRSLYSVNHHLGDTVDILIESREGADWSDWKPWE